MPLSRRSLLQALAALPVVGVLVRREPEFSIPDFINGGCTEEPPPSVASGRWGVHQATYRAEDLDLRDGEPVTVWPESEPDTMTALMVREQDKVPPTFHGIPLEYDRNLDEVAGPPRYYFVPKGRA